MRPAMDFSTERRTQLLRHVHKWVSNSDIEACTIAIDPGYPAYVEQMKTVARTGTDADKVDWEVVFHATSDDPMTQPTPTQFRRYRMLAAAVGTMHPSLAELVSPTQVAISLVEDVVALADPDLMALAYAALHELADELDASYENDTPFVWLAALLVGAVGDRDETELSALAVRIFDEEARFLSNNERTRKKPFLWRCAKCSLDEVRWMRAIEAHLPTSTQSLASLRTALLRSLTAVRE
jgi:hypothetical protein